LTNPLNNLELSVVICTCNRADLLPDVINSLQDQTLENERFEILVVDNNSTDDTAKVIEQFSDVSNLVYFFEKIQGLSAARNRGVAESRGRYVAFLDDDAVADVNWCNKIVEAFRSVDPPPSAVGGIIEPLFDKPPPAWFPASFERRTWGEEAMFLKPPGARDGFSGSNMAFSRDVLLDFGGFSGKLGMSGQSMRFGEETLLFRKIFRDRPYFWYDPQILVHHRVPAGNLRLGYRVKRSFYSGRSYRLLQEETGETYNPVRRLVTALFFITVRGPLGIIANAGELRAAALDFLEKASWRAGNLVGPGFGSSTRDRGDDR